MKLREKDTVLVINGRDRGKRGEIKQVFPRQGTALVEGVNIATKHVKSQGQAKQGGIIKTEVPINISNLTLICSVCAKPSRVGYKKLDDGTNARLCKLCKEVIE
ncbi:MAG: 50S ribosomal protein L24 [Chloroflexi bacterium]|mgnify:CR=1 FL=1|nr:50S ribosomal protein L24 [Chloroflexota bacterium]|tara:strand:- start:88 stop:399 length:312 start_codon:yes stop_codon:yes gene_type:complete